MVRMAVFVVRVVAILARLCLKLESITHYIIDERISIEIYAFELASSTSQDSIERLQEVSKRRVADTRSAQVQCLKAPKAENWKQLRESNNLQVRNSFMVRSTEIYNLPVNVSVVNEQRLYKTCKGSTRHAFSHQRDILMNAPGGRVADVDTAYFQSDTLLPALGNQQFHEFEFVNIMIF
jgi:hypothetical protein